MLKEALAFLFDRAKETQQASFLQVPGDPRNQFLIQGGKATKEVVPPPLRRFIVDRLDALIDAAAIYGQEKESSFWISERQIVFQMNDNDRREAIILPLAYHDHFAALARLRHGAWMQQAELIHFLRVELHGVVPDDLINRFRQVDFKRSTAAQSHQLKERESLGRQVEASVQGIEELPDGFRLDVRVFGNRDLPKRQTIRILLEAKPSEERWRVTAIGEDLDDAIADTLEKIGGEILSATANERGDLRVFSGSPTQDCD